MTRRPLALAVAAAAFALGGCGTFTDNVVVARVGDAELTNDDLRDLAGDLDELPIEEARTAIRFFLEVELLTADLAALDVDVDVPDLPDATPVQALQARRDIVIASWTTLESSVLMDDSVRSSYEAGSQGAGVVCASHIVLLSSSDAETVLAELGVDIDFSEVAVAVSVDPSAENGGFIGCGTADAYEEAFGPEYADVVAAAELGVPTGPVETGFGFHVIRLLPTDELPQRAVMQLRVQTFEDRYDIWVDPRFGEWDPNGIVVPTR